MPTIFDILDNLSFLYGWPGTIIAALIALLLFAARDWRATLLLLLGEYLMLWFLFTTFLPVRLAIVKLIAGLFICLILYLTARQCPAKQLIPSLPEQLWSRDGAIHLLFGVIITAALLALGNSYPLPQIEPAIRGAIFMVVGLGLLNLVLTRHPFQGGIGILLIFAGGELFYHHFQQDPAVFTTAAAINLILTLLIAVWIQFQLNRQSASSI